MKPTSNSTDLYFPIIESIETGSLAGKAGIQPFDSVLRINSEKPEDLIDYRYLISDEVVILELKTAQGKKKVLTIEKNIDQDLGIQFFPIKFHTCPNKCIFCFVDQNPPGMRDDLYVKDEDYRLSFLLGNYITMTNLRKKDIRKIKEKRLSPLYISVHTTNRELRNKILNNTNAPDILNIVKSLGKQGIFMHMQVILIPEVNDGKNLDVTISSLAKLYPKVASIAVVPVGLTRHRQGLTPIKPVSTYLAKQTLNQIKRFQEKYLQEHGTPIVHASDEFYLNTQESFPPREQYGSFEQLENGVGLVQLLLKEFDELSTRFPESTHSYNLEADVVCGKLVAGVLDPIINWFNNLPGISLYLHPVTNNFFGDSITVTGLLTGSDIIQEFKASRDKKTILIPAVTLKYGESVFLDDMSVSQVSSMLNRPVKTFDPTVKGLLDIINCIKRS